MQHAEQAKRDGIKLRNPESAVVETIRTGRAIAKQKQLTSRFGWRVAGSDAAGRRPEGTRSLCHGQAAQMGGDPGGLSSAIFKDLKLQFSAAGKLASKPREQRQYVCERIGDIMAPTLKPLAVPHFWNFK